MQGAQGLPRHWNHGAVEHKVDSANRLALNGKFRSWFNNEARSGTQNLFNANKKLANNIMLAVIKACQQRTAYGVRWWITEKKMDLVISSTVCFKVAHHRRI